MDKLSITKIKRFYPSSDCGLSDAEVKSRINDNLINYNSDIDTKSTKQIIKDNLFTLFNLINLVLGIAVVFVGSYKNLLFLGVVVCNIIIGTLQEIRAKKTVDKLLIIATEKVSVIRNNGEKKISINDIVLDDILKLGTGNQVPSDSILVDGKCFANESLLTGEAEPICKKNGDMLLSGSFIVKGSCKAKVEHIGERNYASKISKEAKYIKKVNSEIMLTLKKIIKIISILIIPIGSLLFFKQFHVEANSYKDAVVSTVAAIIGMIPEGLVLLTSTVLAVSVIRLSKKKVLVQDIYCIETLARVDTLCLDKTGTITEGSMELTDVVPYKNTPTQNISTALCAITSAIDDNNPTFNAIKKFYNLNTNYKFKKAVHFSSELKYSGASFFEKGSFIIGSPEFILKDAVINIKSEIEKHALNSRVLILAHSDNDFKANDNLPDDIEVMAFILINDKLRFSAKKTLKYFNEQDVEIKIISGDNILTVSNIAKSAGVKNYDKCIDMSTIKTYEEIKSIVDDYYIFGRVSPEQKKQIVLALKEKGHTVAMTGDGVNDVLSLKKADCSIAMASGSSAARSVSQIVLLNSRFDAMPNIVKEGRRAINNIGRSASLFLVKTIYSTLLSFIFLFLNAQYPFEPIQMTLTSIFTIGIPSFILALEPNKERVKGDFFANIIKKSFPGAITVVVNILLVVLFENIFQLSTIEASTISVILTAYTGFILLYKICIPFNKLKKILFLSMTTGFVLCSIIFNSVFSLTLLSFTRILILAVLMASATYLFKLITKFMQKSHLIKYIN